jgi:hypothetical protein
MITTAPATSQHAAAWRRCSTRWTASMAPQAPILPASGCCRLPASWDLCEGFSATSMGPPGCQ